MLIRNLSDTPQAAVDMPDGRFLTKQVPLARSDGAPNFVFRVFTIAPGGFTPFHRHDWEHLTYIIQGEGWLVREEDEPLKIGAGDFAFVAPGEKHRFQNASPDVPFVFICAVPAAYE